MQNLGILRAWAITIACHLRTRGIFRHLPNIYNGAFCSEPSVNPGIFKTVACSEPEEYLQSCQASMMQHFFEEPFVTLAYLETLVYVEPEE